VKASERVIYMAHPVSGDVEANLARARRWLLWIYRTKPGTAVVANWILDCEILDDSNPADRQMGLAHDLAILERVDAVWLVGGRVSGGMALEAEHAKAHGVRVLDLTALGAEPPLVPLATVPPGQEPDDPEFKP